MDQSPKFFQQLVGSVDPVNGVIRGVSIITGGVTARGHDLEVDMKTLTQLCECAQKMGKVPVKWNHRSGADAVAGYLSDFRIEGMKLLGDWHLLKSHAQYHQAIELATVMPECIGLSAAFMGEDEKRADGKTAARCEELVSVDVVANPAANPNGFFEALFTRAVDNKPTKQTHMETNNPQQQQQPQPSLEDVLSAIQELATQVQSQQQAITQMQEAANGNQRDDLTIEDLLTMSPEQISDLVQQGHITEEDAAGIHGLQAEALAGGEGGHEGAGGEGAGVMAGAGAGAGGSEFAALQRSVRYLSARFEREDAARENAAIEHHFSAIEKKLTELSTENGSLKELNEKLKTRCDAQAEALKTGTRSLTFSAEGGASLADDDLHEFEKIVKKHRTDGKTSGEAIRLAQKENPDAHQKFFSERRRLRTL